MKASSIQIPQASGLSGAGAEPKAAVSSAVTLSVVVVGHNPGAHLTDMLDSLVEQTEPADEIIYYDDCSDDDSLSILAGYRDLLPGLRVLSGDRRLGVSAARNRANALATSDYIAVLDSDDLFLRDAVALYRQAISKDRSVDFIFADTIVFNQRTGFRKRRHYPDFTRSRHPVASLMARPVLPFKHSSVVYRRSKMAEIGGYREDLFLKVDFEMIIRVLGGGGRIAKLDQPTSCHRTHAGQMSRKRLQGIRSYWKIIDLHEPRPILSLFYKILRGTGETAKLIVGR